MLLFEIYGYDLYDLYGYDLYDMICMVGLCI